MFWALWCDSWPLCPQNFKKQLQKKWAILTHFSKTKLSCYNTLNQIFEDETIIHMASGVGYGVIYKDVGKAGASGCTAPTALG